MSDNRAKLLERAENAKRESKLLDFKREFDTTSAPEWAEIVKDIISFANSGGGVIVFGMDNDGSSAGNDVSNILSLDLADITNKVESFTGYQFADMEIAEVRRGGEVRAALIIGPTDVPLVFIRNGTDVTIKGKQSQHLLKVRSTFVTAQKASQVTAMTWPIGCKDLSKGSDAAGWEEFGR